MSSQTFQQADRVKEATPSAINKELEDEMWNRVAEDMNKSPEQLSERIKELDKKWDIERSLEVNMSTVALTGLAAYAISKNKNWLIMPGIVLGFFMQHALQGWCPPLPVLRKFGLRTRKEMDQEKYALKIIRGDFSNVATGSQQKIDELKKAIKRN